MSVSDSKSLSYMTAMLSDADLLAVAMTVDLTIERRSKVK